MTFHSTILLAGKTATGIEVPPGTGREPGVLPLEQAKTAETRERRLAKAVGMLQERRKR